MFDVVGEAIKRCPFLNALVATEGETFARDVAVNFSKTERTRQTAPTPVEKLDAVAKNFVICHGDRGLLPLAPPPSPVKALPQLSALPTASMSLSSFWGDFNPFRLGSKKKNDSRRPSRKRVSSSASSAGASAMQPAGRCPMRAILGPLATAVMSQRYTCPKPIVMMRAALSKSSVVRALRPESLEIKLLAVALASALLNVPFGMLREHTKKFSPQWFLVVHATIPFIAMFRKAVVMPKYAIVFTIAAAVGGQVIGSKAERFRNKLSAAEPVVDVPQLSYEPIMAA